MNRRRAAALTLAGSLLAAASHAQSADEPSKIESVTVTGQKMPEQVIRDFVKSSSNSGLRDIWPLSALRKILIESLRTAAIRFVGLFSLYCHAREG